MINKLKKEIRMAKNKSRIKNGKILEQFIFLCACDL